MSTEIQPNEQSTAPRWRPLEAIQRRVLGVLVEKAKTTPENYPLSLNSIRAGCNQKNNRAPLMQLEEPQIDEALEELRKAGAVALIQGAGRVDKFRHLAYEWLGVDKREMAVMAELLLRGSQTVGELRGRASRMEPIKDLSDLQPILDALVAKRLIVYLTPPGRGSLVTHALYLDREMDKVQREAGTLAASGDSAPAIHHDDSVPHTPAIREVVPSRAARSPAPVAAEFPDAAALADDLRRLREEVNAVKREFQASRAEWESLSQQLRQELDELNRQLGN